VSDRVNVEKNQISACTCLLFHPFSPSEQVLLNLLEAVIHEAQVLWLKTNPWRAHEMKYLPPTKVTYSHRLRYVHHLQATSSNYTFLVVFFRCWFSILVLVLVIFEPF